MKGIKIFYSLILGGTAVLGCKKLIEIPANAPNTIGTAQVFADSVSAIGGVVGIYSANFLSSTVLSGQITYYPGLSADELLTTVKTDTLFYKNALVANTANTPGGSAGSIWSDSYSFSLIYQTNAAIAGITASKSLSVSLKNQLIGECKVIRALTYFNLANLFGAVPLALTPDVNANNKLARSSPDEVYAFLISDLTDAISHLSIAYPSAGRARPNKYAAMALLAKIQLYQRLWSSAEASSTAIIQSGLYTLLPGLNQVFLSGSKEAIWQIAGVGPYATAEGRQLLPLPGFVPTITVNPYLLNAFEANDKRKTDWISSISMGGKSYNFPYKYKDFILDSTPEGYVMFRLSEQYLIRAEARIEQGKLVDGAADLNVIRNRAGLPNTSASSQADLLQAVMHERQTELFCEWGNRWFDLKRTGTVNAVLSSEKAGIWPADGHAALYPVPGDQIILDPALTQNPGY